MPQTYYLGARSLFVSVTAWLFILLAAVACAAGVVQQATLASWSPALQASMNTVPLPALSSLLMAYLPWVNGAGLLVSVAMLAAAMGLLLRLEWARRAFIGLLLLAIVANLAGLWLQQEFMQSLVDSTLNRVAMPAAALDMLGGLATAARVMGVLVTLSLCLGLAWVVQRLRSPMVRQEFAG